MTKCFKCCNENLRVYESQFPTTWYQTKKCDSCGILLSILMSDNDYNKT